MIKTCAEASSVYFHALGPFTNYVTCFLQFFDHPPTHGNVFAIILLMIYHTRVWHSNAFADHPPTSIALRNLWTNPNEKATCLNQNNPQNIFSQMTTFFHFWSNTFWKIIQGEPTLTKWILLTFSWGSVKNYCFSHKIFKWITKIWFIVWISLFIAEDLGYSTPLENISYLIIGFLSQLVFLYV